MDPTSKHSDRPWSLIIAVITILISVSASWLTAYLTTQWTFRNESQSEINKGQSVLNNIALRYSISLSDLLTTGDKPAQFEDEESRHIYVKNLNQINGDLKKIYENRISIDENFPAVRLVVLEMFIERELYKLSKNKDLNKPSLELLNAVCTMIKEDKILKPFGEDKSMSDVLENMKLICQANP